MDDGNHDEGTSCTPSFRIWLCGTFRMERHVESGYETVRATEWGGSNYPRLLLKALLCCPGRQARRDALLDMLWPDAELEQAAQCLNTATTKLRRVLAPSKGEASLLITEEDSRFYRLAEQSLLWVDVDAALTLLGEAERRGRTSPEALSLLEEAETSFSKGMILQEEEGQWAAGRRATVEQARYRARLWLAEAYAQQQMPGQATTVLSHLLEEDQTDEDVLARLMLLLHRQGMTQQALRVYERACEVAAREGLEFTEATRKLAAQLAASERMYTSDMLISPSAPLLSVSQQAMFPSFLHNMIPDLINRSDYPSQREYTIYNSSNSLIGQTSNNTLLQAMIDRNFSKGITYDLLSSNIKTMNFRDEWQYIVNSLVSEAKTSLRAMVFDTELTRWWNTIAGQIYMKTNMELLRRGVPIRRIFILSSIDTRLRMNTLMNAYVHHKIGIDVKVCKVTGFQNSIPFKPDMFSVHDNLFVALYYFSFEKPITNLLLEDKYILEFKSFYDELFLDDRLCSDIETLLAHATVGEGFFASIQTQLELLQRLDKIRSVTDLARKL